MSFRRNRLSATFGTRDDEFLREFVTLSNLYGKSKQDLIDALDSIHDKFQPGPVRKTSSVYDATRQIPLVPAPISHNMGPPMISPPPAKVRPLSDSNKSLQFPLQLVRAELPQPSGAMMRVSCSPPKVLSLSSGK